MDLLNTSRRRPGSSPTPFHQTQPPPRQPSTNPPPLQSTNTYILIVSWFVLGVICVTSTKVLLLKNPAPTSTTATSLSPLTLSWCQFVIASICTSIYSKRSISLPRQFNLPSSLSSAQTLTSLYYTLGFLLTNLSFSLSSASFTETIKASEPISSAFVAVWFGVDVLTFKEGMSLGVIVIGVVLTSVGAKTATSNSSLPVGEVVTSALVTFAANVCFSLRGAYQSRSNKMKAQKSDNETFLDIVNFGVLLSTPLLLIVDIIPFLLSSTSTLSLSSLLQSIANFPYFLLLTNGISYTIYNLSSTLLLTRLSLIEHATLNCLRRLFAIIVTSLVFGEKWGMTRVGGVVGTVGGFAAFSFFKVLRKRAEQKGREREREREKEDVGGEEVGGREEV